MQVLAHDPLVDDATTPVDALFENADVVSLHAPLTPETRGLVGPELLSRAKPGLVLVNTARGGLVSSLDDLLAALESGASGAAPRNLEPRPGRLFRRGASRPRGVLLLFASRAFHPIPRTRAMRDPPLTKPAYRNVSVGTAALLQ
jgi:hypothetical protein